MNDTQCLIFVLFLIGEGNVPVNPSKSSALVKAALQNEIISPRAAEGLGNPGLVMKLNYFWGPLIPIVLKCSVGRRKRRRHERKRREEEEKECCEGGERRLNWRSVSWLKHSNKPTVLRFSAGSICRLSACIRRSIVTLICHHILLIVLLCEYWTYRRDSRMWKQPANGAEWRRMSPSKCHCWQQFDLFFF